MTASAVDLLVSDYLERLTRASYGLPEDRRVELLEEISEHIDSARAAGAAADEAAVRTLLDRLGEPEEIVASARDDEPDQLGAGFAPARGHPPVGSAWAASPVVTESVRPSTTLETWAVVMLTLGSFVPVVGWLVGVVLLWLSRRWRWWEKLLGTLVVPFGPGLAFILGSFVTTSESCASFRRQTPGGTFTRGPLVCSRSGPPSWVAPVVVLVVVVAPLVVGALLLVVARARSRREPDVTRPIAVPLKPGESPWGGTEIAAVVALGAGAFVVPVIGPLVGLALAWSSSRWSEREKTIATAIAVVPGLVPIAGFGLLLLAAGG